MDENEEETLPEVLSLIDVTAKQFECSECGWLGFMFDWNDDDAVDEQRTEAIRHVRTDH